MKDIHKGMTIKCYKCETVLQDEIVFVCKKCLKRKVSRGEVEELVQACSYCGAVSDTCKGCVDSAIEWLKNHGHELED